MSEAQLIDPDCLAGKHGNCRGLGWDIAEDEPCPCPCPCHTGNVPRETAA